MAKKTAKNEVNNSASAIAADFTAASVKHAERVELLSAMDTSAMDAHDLKQHKEAMLAAVNRRNRCAEFAKLLENEQFAAAFMHFNLTVDAVQKLQIYAQDKLRDTLRAIGMNVPLSSVSRGAHANKTTQAVVQALREGGALQHSQIVGAMNTITRKALSTCSAQSSSSRQVLETLGMLDYSSVNRAYSLNDSADEYMAVLTA